MSDKRSWHPPKMAPTQEDVQQTPRISLDINEHHCSHPPLMQEHAHSGLCDNDCRNSMHA